MRLTYKCDYALKTILDLAVHYGGGPVSMHELAKRQDMPLKFVEQILLSLKRAGFVKSRRGNVGGYLLARHPSQITVGEVVRYIDGPLEPIACTDERYKDCRDTVRCAFRSIWQEVGRETARIVDAVTFEDLVKKTSRSANTPSYQI